MTRPRPCSPRPRRDRDLELVDEHGRFRQHRHRVENQANAPPHQAWAARMPYPLRSFAAVSASYFGSREAGAASCAIRRTGRRGGRGPRCSSARWPRPAGRSASGSCRRCRSRRGHLIWRFTSAVPNAIQVFTTRATSRCAASPNLAASLHRVVGLAAAVGGAVDHRDVRVEPELRRFVGPGLGLGDGSLGRLLVLTHLLLLLLGFGGFGGRTGGRLVAGSAAQGEARQPVIITRVWSAQPVTQARMATPPVGTVPSV